MAASGVSLMERCPLCRHDGATQKVIGTDRMVHPACAEEIGIPTVLIVQEVEA